MQREEMGGGARWYWLSCGGGNGTSGKMGGPDFVTIGTKQNDLNEMTIAETNLI